jgi:hypothetical protein
MVVPEPTSYIETCCDKSRESAGDGIIGNVKAKLMPPPAVASFTNNGVTSQDFGPFPEGFRFVE